MFIYNFIYEVGGGGWGIPGGLIPMLGILLLHTRRLIKRLILGGVNQLTIDGLVDNRSYVYWKWYFISPAGHPEALWGIESLGGGCSRTINGVTHTPSGADNAIYAPDGGKINYLHKRLDNICLKSQEKRNTKRPDPFFDQGGGKKIIFSHLHVQSVPNTPENVWDLMHWWQIRSGTCVAEFQKQYSVF